MAHPEDSVLFAALLDSWDRGQTVLLNLLFLVPEGGLEVRATAEGATVGQMFAHMHYIRMVHVLEDVPEHAAGVPEEEWAAGLDRDRLARLLTESAKLVGEAVRARLISGREMDLHYDHPLLMIQHLFWHEAYHHGQIKLALKQAGMPISDDDAGLLTWGVFMDKTEAGKFF